MAGLLEKISQEIGDTSRSVQTKSDKQRTREGLRESTISSVGFIDKLATGFKDESFVAQTALKGADYAYNKYISDNEIKKDDIWLLDKGYKNQELKKLYSEYGLRKEFQDKINDESVSYENAIDLIEQQVDYQNKKDAVDNSALGGFGYYALGGMLDVAPLIATGNLLGASRVAFGLAKHLTANKTRAGAMWGSYEAGMEAGRVFYGSDRERATFESVMNIAGAGVLGGLLQRKVGKELDEILEGVDSALKNQSSVSKEAMDEASVHIEKGDMETAKEILYRGKLDDADTLEKGSIDDILRKLETRSIATNMTFNVYDKLRLDLGSYLTNSPSETLSLLGRDLVDDPLMLGYKDLDKTSSPVIKGISRKILLERDLVTAYQNEMTPIFKEFYRDVKKTEGSRISQLGDLAQGFLEGLSKNRHYIQDMAFKIHFDLGEIGQKGIKSRDEILREHTEDFAKFTGFSEELSAKYVNDISKAMERYSLATHDRLRESGYAPFKAGEGSIPKNSYYIPHQYKRGVLEQIRQSNAKIRDSEIASFFYESYRKGSLNENRIKTAIEELARKHNKSIKEAEQMFDNRMKSAMLTFIRNATGETHIPEGVSGITSTRMDNIKFALNKEFNGEEDILEALLGKTKGKEGNAFINYRKGFDRSHTVDIRGQKLRFRDFLENNTEAIALKYARKMGGYNALSQMPNFNRSIVNDDGSVSVLNQLKSKENVDALFNKIIQEVNSNPKLSDRRKSQEIARARHILKHLIGEPTVNDPNSIAQQVATTLNSWTIGLKLGMAGLSMVAELNNIIHRAGLSSLKDNKYFVDAVKDIVSHGKLRDEFAQESYYYLHSGFELHDGFSMSKYDDALNPFNVKYAEDVYTPVEKFMNTAQEYGEKLSSFTLMASGIKPFTSMLHFASSYGLMQEIMSDMSEYQIKRLGREANLNPAMINRIREQVNKYGDLTDGERVWKTVTIDGKNYEKLAGRVEFIDEVSKYSGHKPEGLDELLDKVVKEMLGNPDDIKLYQDFRSGNISMQDILDQAGLEYNDIHKAIKGTDISPEDLSYLLKDVEDGLNYVTNELDYITRMAQLFPISQISLENIHKIGDKEFNNLMGSFLTPENIVKVFNDPHLSQLGNFRLGEFLHTVRHEMFHAPTSHAYDKIPQFKKFVDTLYSQAIKQSENINHYGFTNPKEFLAEALSNKEFADILNNIKPNENVAKNFKDFSASESAMFDNINVSKDLGIDVNEGSLFDLTIRAVKMTDAENIVYLERDSVPLGSKIKRMNFKDWDDEEALLAYRAGATKINDSYIQKGLETDAPGIVLGDSLIKNSAIGRMFMNIKDYMFTSYTKQLGKTIANWDDRQIRMSAMTQIPVILMTVAMQNMMNYGGNQKKLEQSFEPEYFISSAIKKLSYASYLPDLFEAGQVLATGSDNRNNGLNNYLINLFAPMTTLTDAGNIISAPWKAMTGKGDKAVESLGKAIPNIPGIGFLKFALLDSVNKEYYEKQEKKKEKEKNKNE